MTRVALAVLVALIAAGCGITGRQGGAAITQRQAVAIARAQAQTMSETPVVFLSASSGQLGSFASNAGPALGSSTRQVWAVVFSGTFRSSCGPAEVPPSSPQPCSPPNRSVCVILDLTSGRFILAETPATGASVHITRVPGLFILPPLDRTISDFTVVTKLATDIQQLPEAPAGAIACPADFGTTYTLAFEMPSGVRWSASVAVSGCRFVTMSNGPQRSALGATSLFADLGAALGLTQDELAPQPCPAPAGAHCFPQPSP